MSVMPALPSLFGSRAVTDHRMSGIERAALSKPVKAKSTDEVPPASARLAGFSCAPRYRAGGGLCRIAAIPRSGGFRNESIP